MPTPTLSEYVRNGGVDNVGPPFEEDCCICHAEPREGVRTTCCRHNFCAECLATWFVSNTSCPYCRRKLFRQDHEPAIETFGLAVRPLNGDVDSFWYTARAAEVQTPPLVRLLMQYVADKGPRPLPWHELRQTGLIINSEFMLSFLLQAANRVLEQANPPLTVDELEDLTAIVGALWQILPHYEGDHIPFTDFFDVMRMSMTTQLSADSHLMQYFSTQASFLSFITYSRLGRGYKSIVGEIARGGWYVARYFESMPGFQKSLAVLFQAS